MLGNFRSVPLKGNSKYSPSLVVLVIQLKIIFKNTYPAKKKYLTILNILTSLNFIF